MAYLGSLGQCVDTLERCNDSLQSMTASLSGLTRTFPRVEAVVRCTRKYDLTTASDIGKAQELISREAVPFLFRQVGQLEAAIEAIRAAHETLERRVAEQRSEYQQLAEDEETMAQLQRALKEEQTLLADEQTSLLNAKSSVAAKERDLAELSRARASAGQKNAALEEASRVEAEIIRVRRMIAETEHETAAIPSNDQIQATQDAADRALVLEGLRDQLARAAESPVDEQVAAFIDGSMATLELLENKVFVPWWDSGAAAQAERMGYMARLLRYFYKEHGSTMHAIIEALLEHQSMSVDDLRRELSAAGHATADLPLLIGHLKTIGAVSSETDTAAGKPVMTVHLDFGEPADADYDGSAAGATA
ncbi:hypothetical protein H4R18_005371 [Coemansia javaensis]|uniref:DASH complex subunit SPC19 n=1 Tax=Coemansia javaensis TaxID=2761396 RepID=A0A9W8H2R0_9FUNG|nr:hypothetical protein H4R18_005371 [Coemansia javaensis]